MARVGAAGDQSGANQADLGVRCESFLVSGGLGTD
jgi:hypothetical protein